MRFIFKLLRFWVLLVLCGSTAYVGINNQETITVSLPPLMTRTMAAWEAFAGFTLFGATIVLIFFGLEHVSLSWKVRKLKKRVLQLESSSGSQASGPSGGLERDPLGLSGPHGGVEQISTTANAN